DSVAIRTGNQGSTQLAFDDLTVKFDGRIPNAGPQAPTVHPTPIGVPQGATDKVVVTFEHIATPHHDAIPVPDGYAGFHWNNFYGDNSRDPILDPDSGYATGVHSGKSVGFNAFAEDASMSADSPFTLKSGWFTGAFLDEMVTVKAYAGGEKVG